MAITGSSLLGLLKDMERLGANLSETEMRTALGLGSVLSGSATYDPPNLTDGSQATTTVTVTGAALGDYVEAVSFSNDLQGIILTGYVSSANTVTCVFQNETAGALDLASGTLRVRVREV